MRRALRVIRFAHPVPYASALQLQEAHADTLAASVKEFDSATPDTLLSLQHPAVYTIGKRGRDDDILMQASALAALGAEVHHVPRGGETTYHGPGQARNCAVLYPVVALRRLALGARAYVEKLEDVMVDALAMHGVRARGRVAGRTGVWVGDRKIGAIGVRISRGVSTHGLALNISPDLTHFSHIVPCGLPTTDVTSLARELGLAREGVDVTAVTQQLIAAFVRRFGYTSVADEIGGG